MYFSMTRTVNFAIGFHDTHAFDDTRADNGE